MNRCFGTNCYSEKLPYMLLQSHPPPFFQIYLILVEFSAFLEDNFKMGLNVKWWSYLSRVIQVPTLYSFPWCESGISPCVHFPHLYKLIKQPMLRAVPEQFSVGPSRNPHLKIPLRILFLKSQGISCQKCHKRNIMFFFHRVVR